MRPSPLPPTPRTLPATPSRRVGAILAAGTLAAGVALGALIGSAPASSLASGERAAAIARVLGLLALGAETGAGSQLALAANAHTQTIAPRATPAASGGTGAKAAASATGSGQAAAPSQASSSTPSATEQPAPANAVSPTRGRGRSGAPAAGAGESKPVRLPPIAHAWLIVLPYGQSFANALGQPAAAPYLTGQLVGKGTLLSGYTALAANALEDSATLLSGQEAAAVSTIVAPCASTQAAGAAPSGAQSTATAGVAAGTPGATPCGASESAGAQAADAFLREAIPALEASAEYREGGLIAITFAAGEGAGAAATGAPAADAPATPAISYPAGAQTSTLTAAGAPGALLLSPFLRRPGARLTGTYDQLDPRTSVAELLTDPSTTDHR
jgi:hypothetical protein